MTKRTEVYSFTFKPFFIYLFLAMTSYTQNILRFPILFFVFFCSSCFAQYSKYENTFFSPLDIPLFLSGNYGEIRATHFHSGVDFKTEQTEGKNVYASKDGYISRISVQAGAYGKALYITHPEGFITVYGHLKSFTPEIETRIREQQYFKRQYAVEVYPAAKDFPVKAGGLIGISGNTGRSGGPHLHFEIRDKSDNIPLNVLKFGFPIADHRRPTLNILAIYALDRFSYVGDAADKMIIPLKNGNGNILTLPEPIPVWGQIGFGIETYDFLDGSANECSPLAVQLQVDNSLVFAFELDRIPFSEGSYVNSHIDYAEKILSGKKIQKLYLDPNNRLGIYKTALNQGVCSFSDSLVHEVDISVSDVAGNLSVLRFRAKSHAPLAEPRFIADSGFVSRFFYDSLNVYENENIRIVVPQNALFRDINFTYRQETAADTLYSALHCIHDDLTPLRTSYILSLRAGNLPPSLTSKALLVSMDKNNVASPAGGSYANGFITARTGFFGRFAIAVDTLPPQISPVTFVNRKTYTEDQIISFRITDNLAGINTYNGYIDGQWALFEHDAKQNLIFYRPDALRISQDREHSLEIVVSDHKNNISKFTGRFYF
jgi:hypothetical protein